MLNVDIKMKFYKRLKMNILKELIEFIEYIESLIKLKDLESEAVK
jgi:hypothetical protein